MSLKKIVVADDDPSIIDLLKTQLESEGYLVDGARSGQAVLDYVQETRPDLLLMDLRMEPGIGGLDVLRRLRESGIDVPTIVITGHGTSSNAIQAMQLGAYDYITKPFDLDELSLTVRRFFDHQRLVEENTALKQQLEHDPSERIIGRHPSMAEVYKLVGRIARSDVTVLIMGETGTGKELVADTIHQFSHRKGGPLIKVACASLPETLLESELFGHEKGSFTTAIAQRKGRFELAHRGTIFLDEIGEMSLNTQKKLLRVLQEREFERVGGSVPIRVDVRVVAATSKILTEEVKKGTFREDLFYRLNVVPITMPPLRERKDDIPLLVEHFLNKHRLTPTSPPARISEEALRTLYGHDWPGNVRELENVIERAVVLAQDGLILPDHIQFGQALVRTDGPAAGPAPALNVAQAVRRGIRLTDLLAGVEQEAVRVALSEAGGDRREAARALGLADRELREKMRRYGIGLELGNGHAPDDGQGE